ncbi:MAG: hypothetical protein HOP32_17775 [Nitrospira sp.]|nr:hypothetical protein [Nitrospira sp.]
MKSLDSYLPIRPTLAIIGSLPFTFHDQKHIRLDREEGKRAILQNCTAMSLVLKYE